MESNGKAAPLGTCLFAYGTLAEPEVMQALLGFLPPSCPARLPDHAAYRLRDQVYPGILREPGTETEGLLYMNLHAEAMAVIDAFEDDLYERANVAVLTADGSRFMALCYRVPTTARDVLSDEVWDPARFRRDHLAGFVDLCASFRRTSFSRGAAPHVP